MQRTGNPELFSEQPCATAQAAVLFAAGFVDHAIRLLEGEIERLANTAQKAWLVLLDIHRVLDHHEALERLTARYRTAFASAPPDREKLDADAGSEIVRLEGLLASEQDLTPLVRHAERRSIIAADLAQVRRIAFEFAPAFCSLLRRYSTQGKHVILANVPELHAELLETVGVMPRIVLLRHGSTLASATDESRRPRLAHGNVARKPPSRRHAETA